MAVHAKIIFEDRRSNFTSFIFFSIEVEAKEVKWPKSVRRHAWFCVSGAVRLAFSAPGPNRTWWTMRRRSSTKDLFEETPLRCWQLDYGRFKYTGLRPLKSLASWLFFRSCRPEPLEEGAEPPEPLSLEDAEQLQLPELRGEEECSKESLVDCVGVERTRRFRSFRTWWRI